MCRDDRQNGPRGLWIAPCIDLLLEEPKNDRLNKLIQFWKAKDALESLENKLVQGAERCIVIILEFS